MKGDLNDWLSYRYRQRLNRSNDGSSMNDNLPNSIDWAGIGFKVHPQINLFAGKQGVMYGGFEYDLNPIEVYQYGNIIENISGFLTGLNVAYNPTPNQQINFQLVNNRTNSFNATYGITEDEAGNSPNLKSSKLPLMYTLNWNGNFDDVFKTRWSASLMNETTNKNLYYYAMGNELNLGKFNMYLDVMYSQEGIDRNGTISQIVGDANGHNVFNTGYLSITSKLNYRFLPRWNAFVKGMYDTASVTKASEGIEKGHYRTSWGYLTGVEFYPMESNLHFFLTYVGQSYNFTSRAKIVDQQDYHTNRISTGFIWQIPVF